MPDTASIIIASRDEGVMLQRTLDSIRNAACAMPYEIIVVDDGSRTTILDTDLIAPGLPLRVIRLPGLGVAPARNAGARLAKGNILVFCDAHITVPDGWLDAFARTLVQADCHAVTPGIGPMEPETYLPLYKIAASAPVYAVGCGRIFNTLYSNTWLPRHASPRECPILSGGCFAVLRDVWRQSGGYEDAFRGYGYDEEEISIKLWLFGYRLMTAPDITILHKFRQSAPYQIITADMLHNRMYAALCHFNRARTERMLAEMRDLPEFHVIRSEVFTLANLQAKQAAYRAKRVHDDDWYFHKFALNL